VSGRKRQSGFTLVELLVASSLGVIVMGSLVSVLWVTFRANDTWDPQLQSSAEVRNFQLAFYQDAAQADDSAALGSNLAGCLNPAPNAACTKQPINISYSLYSSSTVSAPEFVTYCWTGSTDQKVLRIASDTSVGPTGGTQTTCSGGAGWTVVARSVSSWTWYYDDGSTGGLCPSFGTPRTDMSHRRGCIVVNMAVQVNGLASEFMANKSQTMLFYPRLDPSALPAQVP